jgi:hypothetical protein
VTEKNKIGDVTADIDERSLHMKSETNKMSKIVMKDNLIRRCSSGKENPMKKKLKSSKNDSTKLICASCSKEIHGVDDAYLQFRYGENEPAHGFCLVHYQDGCLSDPTSEYWFETCNWDILANMLDYDGNLMLYDLLLEFDIKDINELQRFKDDIESFTKKKL